VTTKRPLGVWFSLALLILIGSAFVGYYAEVGFARAHEYVRSWRTRSAATPEQAHLEAVTSALYRIQARRLFATYPEKRTEFLQVEVRDLERLRLQPDLQDIRPVAEVELAIAYANLAWVAEGVGNSSEAASYMKLGQDLLRGAGWRDSSEDALRLVAKRERDYWDPGAKTRKGTEK
jgi:hypothetical protein